MATVEISSVSPSELNPSDFWGGHLDVPATGDECDSHSIQVAGWVLPCKITFREIVVTWKGAQLVTGPANMARPDVANVFPYVLQAGTCGYAVTVNLLGIEDEFELKLCAETTDEEMIELATIRGCQQALQSAFSPQLSPLMITNCMGRTGSTWLMQLLSYHPDIVIYRQYPYEMGTFRYWMHMLTVLGIPGGLEQTTHQNTFAADCHSVSHNPFNTIISDASLRGWLGHGYVQDLAAFCQRSVDTFYTQLAHNQSQPQAKYFAEKVSGNLRLIPDLVWRLYPHAAEIFYIRDLRDILCSVLAFNAKRGFPDFRYDKTQTDLEYIKLIRQSANFWLAGWKRRHNRAILLRYETLIQDPHEALLYLLDYLKLDSSPSLVSKMIEEASLDRPEMEYHRTSRDIPSSVGRWRHDLSDRHKAMCYEVLANVLQELGYSPE